MSLSIATRFDSRQRATSFENIDSSMASGFSGMPRNRGRRKSFRTIEYNGAILKVLRAEFSAGKVLIAQSAYHHWVKSPAGRSVLKYAEVVIPLNDPKLSPYSGDGQSVTSLWEEMS